MKEEIILPNFNFQKKLCNELRHIGDNMRSLLIISIISLCVFIGCKSSDIEQPEKNNNSKSKIILSDEYISISGECVHKILSNKLIGQMNTKRDMFNNEEITEEELIQKVYLYFESELSQQQKDELTSYSVKCDWESWTPPTEKHPFGFISAEILIEQFENVLCLDFLKKIDTAEILSEPDNEL